MAKPPSAIGRAKREAAFNRRLARGAKKMAAKQARINAKNYLATTSTGDKK